MPKHAWYRIKLSIITCIWLWEAERVIAINEVRYIGNILVELYMEERQRTFINSAIVVPRNAYVRHARQVLMGINPEKAQWRKSLER